MAKIAKSITLLVLILINAGCWSDRSPCDLWAGKLARGEEIGPSIRELQLGRCVQSQPLLLDHLADPGFESDILTALIGLGRSPEAEVGVKRALTIPATAGAAAAQVVSWAMTDTEPELRAALAQERLIQHWPALLEAALVVAPADRWVPELARALGDTSQASAPLVDRALAALLSVDWSKATNSRVAAIEALAELATQPVGVVPRGRVVAALAALAKVGGAVPPLEGVVERARKGNRQALLVLAALAHPALEELTLFLAARPEIETSTRWLALALRKGRPGSSMEADKPLLEALKTCPADADIVVGLAMTLGPVAAPALAQRRISEKGSARAAFARAQSVVLTAEDLEGWLADLAKEPSVLLRVLATESMVVGFIEVIRGAGYDEARLSSFLSERTPRLATLDSDLVKARREVEEARTAAEAQTLSDSQKAKELAQATGGALAEARVEMAAIQTRLEAAYRPVETLTHKVEAFEQLEAEALLALSRLVGTQSGASIATSVLDACPGAACARLRAWAVAVVSVSRPLEAEARFELLLRASSE